MDVERRRWHSNKAGCSDTVAGADEVSHINGWVSLVSDIHVGLAYLIDLPEKTQAKMGKGKEKRQFLTEKASDRESFGLFRHDMANNKHHTERRFPVGSRIFQSIKGILLYDGRRGRESLEAPIIRALQASLSGWNDCPTFLYSSLFSGLLSVISKPYYYYFLACLLCLARVASLLHWSQHGCIALWYVYLGAAAVLLYT